ncbi:hypothetical protein FQN55_002225 [Onygenales sp. PD_40]|nr:hypothetical protein FQN55_002225 [Onygenales sp. PD_40]KAK2775171.1 hypothetical protein FQN52_004052 [Onygenales sp. PD_12]KAK2782027.1 hypothetical protein FQN53_000203 [Emmonsiellopsis sp. PD_33]
MASSIGRILNGQKASYKLLATLKEPSLYKAAVIPPCPQGSSNLPPPGKFVAVKDLVLERELHAHRLPYIQGAKFIRQAVDVIIKSEHDDWTPSLPSVNKRIVFEWMDTDLWTTRPFGKPFSNPKLPAIVAKSILEALLIFQQTSNVHTDVNPNNIFLSDLEAAIPTVKLGDLDNAFSEGAARNYQGAQTHETRAPEVWQGLGVWHSSDIWSLAVTITHWLMSSTLFGPRDKIIQGHQTAWCLAKIFRLIGHIDPPENPDFKDEFELAKALELGGYLDPKTGEPKEYLNLGSLREELSKLPREICSETCIDFIEHLLVIDPEKRPTAEMALKHPFVSSITT